MEVPDYLRYTRTEEWIRVEGDEAVVGITDYAQSELGDLVFLELPEVGRYLQQEEAFGTVESVKTASDLYAPVEGEVIARNEAVLTTLEKINQDPYGEGWLIRLKMTDPSQVESLMTAEQYRQFHKTD